MSGFDSMVAQAEPGGDVSRRVAHTARRAAEFCGWAGLSDPPQAARLAVSRLADASRAHLGAAHLQTSHFGVAVAGDNIELLRDGDVHLLLAGRPRWRDGNEGEPGEVARRVLDGYRSGGARVLDSLAGTFALVLAREDGREALLAVDRMAVSPLVYARVGRGIVFGSSVQHVTACLDAKPSIDLQSVFNYLFLHCVPGPATIVEGPQRILAGHCVHLRDGRLEYDRYWKPRYAETARYELPELVAEFRRLFEQGVARALARGEPGAFLSGGTDSSTVAGMLSRLLGKGARTYSIGFEAEGYDEMSYARIAARHFGTDHHEYYVTPADVLAVARQVSAYCDQPFGNASAVPAYHCAKLAEGDGVAVLFGGDGGDELFGGNERYAMQAIYGLYDGLPAFLRKGLIEPALSAVPGGQHITLIRKGRGFVAQTALPVPMRVYAHNMLQRSGFANVFTPEFLSRVDAAMPSKLLCGVYDDADAQSVLNRMLAVDLQFTLGDNDLYKVSRMCEMAGVEAAYPMLDDDLVAFSLRLPSRLKLKGRRLRWFFKEALRDFLPPEVIVKRKHGFGLPVGLWMHSHPPLRELGYGAVRALGMRGVIRPDFLERMMASHQDDDAAYWGNELWVMSQLELWLQHHGWAAGRALL